MKLGFIGFGKSVNRYHMPFIDVIDELEVTGYYTRGTKEFEMIYPFKKLPTRYTDLDDFLSSDVEIVVISTPASTHYELAKKALESGKNVIVEKPFCETLNQAKELYKLAEKNNVLLSPYQNRRYDSDFLTIKNIIQNGDIGKVMEIESNHTHYRTDGADNTGNKYDGSVYGHAVHFIDQIVSMYGEPDDVIYDIANQKNYYIGEGEKYQGNIPEDYYDIKLVYGNLRVRVRFSQLIVKEPPRWIINSTKATVEKYMIDQQESYLKKGIYLDDENFGVDTKEGITKIYTLNNDVVEIDSIYQTYSQFYKDYIKALKNEKSFPIKENEVYIVLNILETIVNHKKFRKIYGE